MKTIELIAVIPPNRTLTVQLPDDVSIGTQRIIILVDQLPTTTRTTKLSDRFKMLDWGDSSLHSSWSREELYDDDGC